MNFEWVVVLEVDFGLVNVFLIIKEKKTSSVQQWKMIKDE
jgi:hypothetical protein